MKLIFFAVMSVSHRSVEEMPSVTYWSVGPLSTSIIIVLSFNVTHVFSDTDPLEALKCEDENTPLFVSRHVFGYTENDLADRTRHRLRMPKNCPHSVVVIFVFHPNSPYIPPDDVNEIFLQTMVIYIEF